MNKRYCEDNFQSNKNSANFCLKEEPPTSLEKNSESCEETFKCVPCLCSSTKPNILMAKGLAHLQAAWNPVSDKTHREGTQLS